MAEPAPQPDPGPILALARDALLLLQAGDERRPAARVVEVNRLLLDLLGIEREAVLERGLSVLRGPRTDPAAFARLVGAIEERVPVELALTVPRADGAGLVVELLGRPIEVAGAACYALHLEDVTDRRDAELAIREVAAHFQAISELTSDYVYALAIGPDGRQTLEWAAGAFARLTGYGQEELEARGGWTSMVEPEDLPRLQRRNQRLIAGEAAEVDYRIVTRTGERRWLADRGRPEREEGEGGLVVRLICAASDITLLRTGDERLAASESERKVLAEQADALVCRFDAAGRLQEVAGRGPGELSLRLQAAQGRPLDEALGPELAWAWRQQQSRVVEGGAPVAFRFRLPLAGIEETFEARLVAAARGFVLALIRPLAAPAPAPVPGLAEAPDTGRLAALLDSIDVPVLRLSEALVVVEQNAAAARVAGRLPAELRGRGFLDLLVPLDQHEALGRELEAVLRGARVRDRPGAIILPDGSRRPVVWSLAPLTDAAGRPVEILVGMQPAAATADAEQALRAGQKRLGAIMDHVADGIVTIDAAGVIESFSRAAEAIFDYAEADVLGRHVDRLITAGPAAAANGDHDVLERLRAASRQPRELSEMLGRRRSGEAIPIELAVKEVDLDGRVLFILTVRDITLRKQTEETIRNLAYHDPLTALPNRLLFHDRLSQAVERARRNRQMLAVMLLDLDRFKLINDSLGLEKGDQVLRAVGERLTETVRRSDTVARLGGDEFLLLLPGTEGAEAAAKVSQKLLDCLRPHLIINGHELNVSASIGIALYPHDGENAETLIKNADTALYRAKEQGRNVYQFYTNDMNAAAFERLVLETQLRKALERGELVLYYQPQLGLASGEVVGVEALVRWFHPDLGMIPPGDFIPLAEETGLILSIGEWVLRTACTQVQRWHRLGFESLSLAVNLSARQFQQSDLVPTVGRLLAETGFRPEQLELELTESIIMRHAEETVDKLRALDQLGIRLAVDDFGTGYSSLSYLKRFPIRSLKIDRSFIQDITTDANDAAIAQAIIALAESLNLKVIAEGVETEQQLEMLRRYRCDEIQGFLFSRPLPADELLALLREGRRLPG